MQIDNGNQGGQNNLKVLTINTPSSTLSPGNDNPIQKDIKVVQEIEKMDPNKKVNEQDAKEVIDKLNKLLQGEKTHAEYEIHEGFKDIMIKIVDDDTKQVIREIPPKKVLDVVQKLCEMVGIMFDKKV